MATPVDPFELLRSLQKAALPDRPEQEPEGAADPVALVSQLAALLRSAGSEHALPKLVDALRLAHLRASDPQGEARAGEVYDAARSHFHKNEAQLRDQARLTDRILDRIQVEGAAQRVQGSAAFQQELRLRTAQRARASGRFVLRCDLERGAAVEFRCGRLRGLTLPWSEHVPVHFTPDAPLLRAGEEVTVRAEVDLGDCPAGPGDELELCVDVLCGGELLEKLWILVSVDAAPREAHT